jgi:CheY-like chemotaxis protein
MNDEQLSRLFRPFSQADASMSRRFGGTGLGLTISRRLANMLGGDITVASSPGAGSTFSLTFDPGALAGVRLVTASTPAAPRPAAGITDTLPTPRLECRILLAEDGPDNQRLISHVLRKAGATIDIVENGQLAVERALEAELGTSGPPYDLVLLDMQMPVLDGYGAARRLREFHFKKPIVALTAHAMTGDREKCLEAGCDDYATKPIRRRELIEQLAQLIKSRAESGASASAV